MRHPVMINGLEAEFRGATPPKNTTLLNLLTRQKAVVANFDKGVVSLWGQASSDEDLQELERLLLLLPAVKQVDNHLEVTEPVEAPASGEDAEDGRP
jgi:hypothetical protein